MLCRPGEALGLSAGCRVRSTDAGRTQSSALAKGVNVPFPGEVKCPVNLMPLPHRTKEMQKELTQATGNFFFLQQQMAHLHATHPADPKQRKN